MIRYNQARGHQDPELEFREVQMLLAEYGRSTVQRDMGYLDSELAHILKEEIDANYLKLEKNAQPEKRNTPVDMIFTWNAGSGECCIAIRAGFKFGIQSSKNTIQAVCRMHDMPGHQVTFVDNNYFSYDHDIHMAVVKHFKPNYATTRDIITRQQCQDGKIPYYSLEQILDWAAEVEQYAQNVILIPKYDCMDKIPPRYMLGYSVPTSHGGTPLPVEMFKGWRVHLLGGSWKAQLAHMAALGDDVVSVDNNYIQKMANYGQFNYPDGSTGALTELLGEPWLTNPREVAFAFSVGAVHTKINEIHAGSMVIVPESDYSEEALQENYV